MVSERTASIRPLRVIRGCLFSRRKEHDSRPRYLTRTAENVPLSVHRN